jgi:hypothetical protein
VRDEVKLFAEAMEVKLAANDRKGGWRGEPTGYLMRRLRQEVEELGRAREAYEKARSKVIFAYEVPDIDELRADVRQEAADVDNFCMMIADVVGGLS